MGENTNRTFETDIRDILDRLIVIETKLDNVKELHTVTNKNQQDIIKIRKDTDEQERRILTIESSIQWLWRTVAGAAITAIVGIIITFGR